jgi:hypothetical protein
VRRLAGRLFVAGAVAGLGVWQGPRLVEVARAMTAGVVGEDAASSALAGDSLVSTLPDSGATPRRRAAGPPVGQAGAARRAGSADGATAAAASPARSARTRAAFDRAVEAAERRDWEAVVDALATAPTPPRADPLRRSWDSLLASAALRQAVGAEDAMDRRRLAALARARAADVIALGPAGSRSLAPMRYVRGRACAVAPIGCDEEQMIEDFTWVRAHGTYAQRAEARTALEQLRSR